MKFATHFSQIRISHSHFGGQKWVIDVRSVVIKLSTWSCITFSTFALIYWSVVPKGENLLVFRLWIGAFLAELTDLAKFRVQHRHAEHRLTVDPTAWWIGVFMRWWESRPKTPAFYKIGLWERTQSAQSRIQRLYRKRWSLKYHLIFL